MKIANPYNISTISYYIHREAYSEPVKHLRSSVFAKIVKD